MYLLEQNLVFFALHYKFYAIWSKNKEAMAIKSLVYKILVVHFVRILNSHISATIWHELLKFWLMQYFVIRKNIYQSKK